MKNVRLKLRKFLKLFSLSTNLLRFISGGEVLPLPYSVEEENLMIERLSNGETQIRDLLIEHNLRLVVYIARRFENTGVNLEDLIFI